MSAGGRLQERFAQMLGLVGADVPASDKLAYAVDFVRLLAQATLENREPAPHRREALRAMAEQHVRLDEVQAALLVKLAEAPEFRGLVDDTEREAFVARFGPAAGRLLDEEEQQEIDLSGFAHRYGSGASLELLDAILAVCAADGDISPRDLRRADATARELGIDAVAFAVLLRRHDTRDPRGWSVPLTGERVRIGRSAGSDLILSDPQVAPLHAELVRTGQVWRVVDAESGRPTVLNGRPVTASPMGGSDELRIGPYTIRIAGGALRVSSERNFSALSARKLTRKIGDVSLLDDVSFTVFAGEVVALIGPSGAGKTTLLNAIAGVAAADSGEVEFDGVDFHTLLKADRSRVGIVPQDDIVHPELTVEESLGFSGRLRFSASTTSAEVDTEVDRVIHELAIDHIRKNRIGDALRRGISGGQRKRVNLGQELLTRSTRVLFLDEPTSGLDPRASQDIVRLVRQLADRGRIVFIVTHDLTPQVMAQVDHLLVLAAGGRLAYFGPPAEACRYFNVPTPDAIFGRFGEKEPGAWRDDWQASDDARRYVATRERLLQLEARPKAEVHAVRRNLVSQCGVLIRRYARVKGRDVGGLTVLLAQAPVLALVMRVVFQYPTREMLFMLSLSCLWFGMSASVRELISDRVIWLRERRVGVGTLPYVASKVSVLGVLVAAQCAAFAAMNLALFPSFLEYGFHVPAMLGVAALTGLVGMALGLAVSAWNNSSEGAVGSLPLLLIPQIAFSGILLSLRRMSELARSVTGLNPARYAYDMLLKTSYDAELGIWGGGKLASPPIRGNGDWNVLGVSGDLYNLGFKGDAVDDYGLSMGTLLTRMCLFGVLFLALAVVRVWKRRAE